MLQAHQLENGNSVFLEGTTHTFCQRQMIFDNLTKNYEVKKKSIFFYKEQTDPEAFLVYKIIRPRFFHPNNL